MQFFITFCAWSSFFTAYIAVVLAVKMGTQGSLDGQMLALVIVYVVRITYVCIILI